MTRSPLLLLSVVLVSGAGLLAFGVLSLWRGMRDVQAQARDSARRDAAASARALRRVCADRRILEPLSSALRFAVAGGRLQVPETLGWYREPPVETPELDLPGSARELLVRADQESWRGDAAAASAILAEALAGPGNAAAGRARLLTAAATRRA